jgi:hypothetical protein
MKIRGRVRAEVVKLLILCFALMDSFIYWRTAESNRCHLQKELLPIMNDVESITTDFTAWKWGFASGQSGWRALSKYDIEELVKPTGKAPATTIGQELSQNQTTLTSSFARYNPLHNLLQAFSIVVML